MEIPKNPKLWQVFMPIALAGTLLYGGWRYAINKSQLVNNHTRGLESKVIEETDTTSEPNNLSYVVDNNVKECALEETPKSREQDIDYKRLYEIIAKHEGIRNEAYFDTERIRTIGAGFNLEKSGAKERIENLGLDYNDVFYNRQKLSNEQIYILMKEDVETAISDAKNYVGKDWNKLNSKAKEVIIDMSYNMGATELKKFKKLKEALNKLDYQTAADEMKDSKWYYQTKSRAKEDIAIMRSINSTP